MTLSDAVTDGVAGTAHSAGVRYEETKMIMKNEGTADRALRVVAGLAILSLVFVGPKTPWAWVGLVPVLTGLVGWCPLYTLLGINSCGTKKGA